jgi:hypothetical protein
MSTDKRKDGQAALATVMIISVILIGLTIAAAMIAAGLASTANSQRLSSQALSDAKAGANDAFSRIIRYKNCPVTPGCPSTYSITIGPTDSSTITITPSTTPGVITIISIGVSLNRYSSIQEIVGVDSVTGLVNLESTQQIAD